MIASAAPRTPGPPPHRTPIPFLRSPSPRSNKLRRGGPTTCATSWAWRRCAPLALGALCVGWWRGREGCWPAVISPVRRISHHIFGLESAAVEKILQRAQSQISHSRIRGGLGGQQTGAIGEYQSCCRSGLHNFPKFFRRETLAVQELEMGPVGRRIA